MGLADTFGAEDRAQIKTDKLIDLVRHATRGKMLLNAIRADVPREQILKMLSGQNDELEEYHKIGLTPDQIREMDHLYSDKCREYAVTAAEKDTLEKQVDDLLMRLDEQNAAEQDGEEKEATQAEEENSETQEPDTKKKRPAKKIDKGKILALKQAGWKVKDIAEDMGLEASAVSQVLWRENQKAKQMGNDENTVL